MSILIFAGLTCTTIAQKASEKKLFQRVNGGAIFATFASTNFSKAKVPFALGNNLIANVAISTPKTYHNMVYRFGNHSVGMINGYFLKKNWDTYVVISKSFNGGQYLGWGVEKLVGIVPEGAGIKSFLFVESGTNLSGGQSLTLGVLFSMQNRLWKREK